MAQEKIVNLDQKIKATPKTSISTVNELALKTTKKITIKSS